MEKGNCSPVQREYWSGLSCRDAGKLTILFYWTAWQIRGEAIGPGLIRNRIQLWTPKN